jgi:hypothetical protein
MQSLGASICWYTITIVNGLPQAWDVYWPTLLLVFIAGARTFSAIRTFKNTEQQTKDKKAFD